MLSPMIGYLAEFLCEDNIDLSTSRDKVRWFYGLLLEAGNDYEMDETI